MGITSCIFIMVVLLSVVSVIWKRKLSAEVRKRNLMEERLGKSEKQFRGMFEDHSAVMFLIDPQNGNIVQANRAARNFYGLSFSEDHQPSIFDINHLPVSQIKAAMTSAKEEKCNYFQFKHKIKNGNIIDVEVHSSPIPYNDKKHLFSIIHDITDRKRAEERLKESEANLKTLVESTEDLIAYRDRESRLVVYNRAFEKVAKRITGHDVQVGMRTLDYLSSDERKYWWEIVRNVLGGKVHQEEFVYEYEEGSRLWYDISFNPIREGDDIIGYTEYTRDVTERKRMERALQEGEQRYRLIFDMANDAIFLHTIDPKTGAPGRFFDVNQTACTWLSYSKSEMLQLSPLDILTRNYRYDADNLPKLILERKQITYEIAIVSKDGEEIQVEASSHMFDYIGKSVVLIVARNISDRKRIENEILHAKNAAESANRAKSEFLANMSHELRTPLNAILGFTQILLNKRALSVDQHDALMTIHRSGEHLLVLINDILDISKIESGKLSLELSDFRFKRLLHDIVELVTLKASDKDVALFFHFEPGNPEYVYGDEKRLRQVLLNLLSNAVKFTCHGRVELTMRYQDGIADFTVADTGIGIPEDKLEDVFKPFEQVTGISVRSEGTGLGLSISRRLVRLMGSEIFVESELGKGSTFRFSIPLPCSTEVMEGGEGMFYENITGFEGDSKKILVVDDNVLNVELINRMLDRFGFETHGAYSGGECIESVERIKPDLVFLDLVMPDMDGIETVKRIREVMGSESPGIIMVTGDPSDEVKDRCDELGCKGFIEKPVILETLLHQVRDCFDLTWIYGRDPKAEGGVSPDNGYKPVHSIPEDVLEKFERMSNIGDVRGIYLLAAQLKKTEPEFETTCNRLMEYCNKFEIYKIKEMISRRFVAG